MIKKKVLKATLQTHYEKIENTSTVDFSGEKNKSHEIVDAIFKADKNYLKARIPCS